MIQELTMYTVVCDGCGKDSNADSEYSAWGCKMYAADVAMEANFINEGDEHYCPDCYSYDDEDNLVIKKNQGGEDETK
jgi:hypothetical protein